MKAPYRLIVVSLLFSCLLAALLLKARAQERGLKVDDAPQGRYFALVIGNDDYKSLQHLRTAVNDAREVEDALRSLYGFRQGSC
jgi:caspase domain-containing protein